MTRRVIIAGDLDPIEYYPTHICVPLPQGEVTNDLLCGLMADDIPISTQINTVAHWPDGSAKIQHVWANLLANVTYEYFSNEQIAFPSDLSVIETSARIEVDNGLFKVLIDKIPNAGFIQIREMDDELLSSSKHFMIDERMISFSLQYSQYTTVEVEHVGPVMVCIKIHGWYDSQQKRVPPFVLGTTRVYIFANSPIIKIDLASTFGANMNLHGVGQMGMDFGLTRPYSIQMVSRYGTEKFPYYITQTNTNAIFWQWPGTNRVDKNDESEISVHNLYKNLWLHDGPLLDPRMPNRYFEAWQNQTDTTEIKAEYARAANMQGTTMRAQFAIIAKANLVTPFMKLYKDNPIGIIEPSEAVRTNVFGPIAPYLDHESEEIAKVDSWVNRAAKGNFGSIARYGDYGVFNWGNLHSDEFISKGRPSLHRCYSNNHYGFNSVLWMLFFRSADYDILKWIRIANDYYAEIGQVRYDQLAGKPDGTPGPETKHHMPGAFWHCKGGVPFGGRDYGMDANDIDADLIGHWPDPTSLLWGWLINACDFSRDGYEIWADNVAFRSSGWAREVNTSIVHAIYLYEYLERSDTSLLARIQGMKNGLMSIPLKDQAPGPIWHPNWLSVYYETFPDDTQFKDWLVAQAPAVMPGIEGCWAMSLAATLTDITGDTSWIEKQFSTVNRATKVLVETDDLWNDYGCKPGPSNDWHFMLQWPRLAAAYLKHDLYDIAGVYEPGNYLFGISRLYSEWPDDMEHRGTHIFVLIPEDIENFDITIDAAVISAGSLQGCSMYVKRPDGSMALSVPRLPITNNVRNRKWRASNYEIDRETYTIQTNGVGGLWEIVFGSDGIGLFQKLTQYPEAQRLQSLNGPMPISGEQIRHKIKHGMLYLKRTKENATGDGFMHVKAMGAKCATNVNGMWTIPAATVEYSFPNPSKLEVFSDGDGWAQVEIDYEARYPFWASSTQNDVELISKNSNL